MTAPDNDILNAIDALFQDGPADVGDRRVLASVCAACHPLAVRAVAILDARGHVIGSYDAQPRRAPWDWTARGAEILAALGQEEVVALPAHDDGASLLGVRLTALDDSTGCLALATLKPVNSAQCPEHWRRRLALAGRLAWAALEAGCARDENAVRVTHLVTEQRTLLRDHARIVESNLNEREAAMREKRELIAALEDQIALRTRDLRSAMEEAEQASHHKSEFLANVSHEIRTPMTAIIGYSDILLESGLRDQGQREAAQTIQRNAQHLLQLINDILDLSKIEAGRLTAERISCSPAAIIADVTSLMRGRADEKHIALDVAFEGPIPATICTDPTRFRQVLTNLVGNAVKFTEQGGVRIIAKLASSDPAKPLLHVRVEDTGIGMTQAEIQKVFEPFVQADDSTTRRFGGTGLGLTISRHLARQLGGDLTAQSRKGAGSIFRVTISTGPLAGVPMVTSPTEPRPAEPEPHADGPHVADGQACLDCSILLAEDGPDNQRLISYLLKKAGANVTVVENGKLAMDAALAAEANQTPFDIILMDMQMPVMDGYTATTALRDRGYKRPIIALTAHAMARDRERCLNAGCDDYATKPINRAKLIEVIRQAQAGRQSPRSAGEASTTP